MKGAMVEKNKRKNINSSVMKQNNMLAVLDIIREKGQISSQPPVLLQNFQQFTLSIFYNLWRPLKRIQHLGC